MKCKFYEICKFYKSGLCDDPVIIGHCELETVYEQTAYQTSDDYIKEIKQLIEEDSKADGDDI